MGNVAAGKIIVICLDGTGNQVGASNQQARKGGTK